MKFGKRVVTFLSVICILLSAYCSIRGTLFLRTLIDDYITPMTQQANPDFGPLAAAIGKMAGIYAIGIASSYCYNRLMVNISQGTMLRLRKELNLPATLKEAGVPPQKLWHYQNAIVEAALKDPCMQTNPICCDAFQLRRILEAVSGRG